MSKIVDFMNRMKTYFTNENSGLKFSKEEIEIFELIDQSGDYNLEMCYDFITISKQLKKILLLVEEEIDKVNIELYIKMCDTNGKNSFNPHKDNEDEYRKEYQKDMVNLQFGIRHILSKYDKIKNNKDVIEFNRNMKNIFIGLKIIKENEEKINKYLVTNYNE